MKKRIISLICIVFLFTAMHFLSGFYPGETIIEEHNLKGGEIIYKISDNNTIIPELNISINSSHIIFPIPQDMPPSSFSIVFIEKDSGKIVKKISSSSSGSGGKDSGGGGSSYSSHGDAIKVLKTKEENKNLNQDLIKLNSKNNENTNQDNRSKNKTAITKTEENSEKGLSQGGYITGASVAVKDFASGNKGLLIVVLLVVIVFIILVYRYLKDKKEKEKRVDSLEESVGDKSVSEKTAE